LVDGGSYRNQRGTRLENALERGPRNEQGRDEERPKSERRDDEKRSTNEQDDEHADMYDGKRIKREIEFEDENGAYDDSDAEAFKADDADALKVEYSHGTAKAEVPDAEADVPPVGGIGSALAFAQAVRESLEQKKKKGGRSSGRCFSSDTSCKWRCTLHRSRQRQR
jgi:hypothetical protein